MTPITVLSPLPDAPPILLDIARCESGMRQFDENGEVLRGKVNKSDLGFFQINAYYHLESSKKAGFDIYTEEGNIGYALWLYKKEGTQPWKASEKCWSKSLAVPDV